MPFQPDTQHPPGNILHWLRPDEQRAFLALNCEDIEGSFTVRNAVPPLSKLPKAQRNDPEIIAERDRRAKRAGGLLNDRFYAHGADNIWRLLWRLAAEREAAAGGKIFEAYAEGDDPLMFGAAAPVQLTKETP